MEQSWTIQTTNMKWTIPNNLLKTVAGVSYVKLVGTCYSLVRLVCHDIVKLPKNPSLAGTAGWVALQKLRNDSCASPAPSADALFGAVVHTHKKKRSRKKVVEPDDDAVTLDLPGVDMTAQVLKPNHPSEDIHVRLAAEDINAIIAYVRFIGVDLENKGKRTYKQRGSEDQLQLALVGEDTQESEATGAE